MAKHLRNAERIPFVAPIEHGLRSLRSHLQDPSGALSIDGLDVTIRALALAVIVALNVAGVNGASEISSRSAWVVVSLIAYNAAVVALLGVPFKRAPSFALFVVDWLVGSTAIIVTGGIFSPFLVLYFALAIGAALRTSLYRSLLLVGGCATVLLALAVVTPVSPALGLPIVVVEITSLLMAVVTTVGMRHAVEVEAQRLRMEEQTVVQLRQLNADTQAVLAASGTPDLRVALQAVAAAARRSVDGDRALAVLTNVTGLTVADNSSDGIIIAADRYPAPPYLTQHERGMLQRVSSTLQTITDGEETQVACTPLLIGSEILGAVFVYTDRPGRFSGTYIALLGNIGRQMALAIRLAHLYELERQRAQCSEESERIERDLLTVVSHELRTPLTALKTGIEALKGSAINQHQHHEDKQHIEERLLLNVERSTDRLVILTDELLDMARLRAGRVTLSMQPLNLANLIREIVPQAQPLLDERDQTLNLDLPALNTRRWAQLSVLGNRRRIEQVVLNLLSNAAKYSPRGSSILIGTTAREGNARVFVRDEGPGINSEEQGLIFEKFYQGDAANRVSDIRAQGLGLGLAIARSIIEMHGGTIGVIASPGKGSTFYFALPLYDSSADGCAPVGKSGQESAEGNNT
ncbi:MAG: ATP-binding protein [Chloroflexia bacterium]